MIEIIGIVLLLYGIIGIVGSLTAYWWLVRPQGPVAELRNRLTFLANRLQESAQLARRANDITPKISDISQTAYDNLGEIIKPLRQGAVLLGDAAVVVRGTERLLNGTIDRVLGVSETNKPQVKVQLSTGTQLDELSRQVDKLGDLVTEVKYFSRDARVITDELSRDLEPFPREIEEGRQMVLEVSDSKWLATAPVIVTMYFGLTHVAFALVGLALISFS